MTPTEATLRAAVPPELQRLTRWACWRSVPRPGQKPAKLPINARTGGAASSTDPTTWAPFGAALWALRSGRYGGLSFALTEADGFVGIDLDRCYDPQTGHMADWAADLVAAFGSYAELSPSHTGIHVICRGRKPGPQCRKGDLEVYSSARFLTVTGQRVNACGIADGQAALDALWATTWPPEPAPVAPLPDPPVLADTAILRIATRARNGAKARALLGGDLSGYGGNASQADLALCSLLAFYTACPAQIDRLFRHSGLMRPKWDERRGTSTYGAQTVARALAGCRAHWAPREPVA